MTPGARITPYRDGPILVRGGFSLVDQDGNDIPTHQRTVALCRCGRSSRKPFCDGTHKAIGWRAPSAPGDPAGDERRDGGGPDASTRSSPVQRS
jgi:CDGSH-type Zn-finger protein